MITVKAKLLIFFLQSRSRF